MEDIEQYIQKVKPDQITGKLPTKKQLEVMILVNPFRAKSVKYSDAAKILGITVSAVKERMTSLRKRCPQIWKSFRRERFKDRVTHQPTKHTTGCVGCGCDVPEGQEHCYRCWRKLDRFANPELYWEDPMFPANGKTMSKIDLDIMEEINEKDRW
jgi:hypothetical protein